MNQHWLSLFCAYKVKLVFIVIILRYNGIFRGFIDGYNNIYTNMYTNIHFELFWSPSPQQIILLNAPWCSPGTNYLCLLFDAGQVL